MVKSEVIVRPVRKLPYFFGSLMMVLALVTSGFAHTSDPDCIKCHGTEANEVHGSVHYQWQGPALDMVNQPGTPQGKLTNAVNSYCINILGNWAGCSACHIGKGAKPDAVASPTQLANIDCLKCHGQGGVLPTRVDCLKCHAKAGGGDAVKRGDLALATGNTTDRNYDVHMATTGANLPCQSCHITRNHRIAGKGSDLRATDLDVTMECTQCHSPSPHSNSSINKHLARVACQTCHIPVYAKNAVDTAATEATETFRTWKSSEAATAPKHPTSVKANNLMPEYRFWNRTSNNYLLGDVAKIDAATGKYPTSRPVGSVQDGKLYPFKYKTAEQPMASGSNVLIALDTSVFFATADPAAAVRQGLLNMGMSESTPWEWVQTDTFQLLNHQVSPEEQALQCTSCHGTTTRMDLKGRLGYQLKAAKSSVCSQCHENESYSGYAWIHDKHVTDKKFDCSWCHTFSRPERGLRMSSGSVGSSIARPAGITVPTADGDGSYPVTWAPSTTTGVTYVLQEATNPTFTSNLRTAYSGTGTSKKIANRSRGRTYYYRVKAIMAGQADSAYRTGNSGCAVPGTAQSAKPASIAVPTADTDGEYTVRWGKSATVGVKYLLEEATNSTFTEGVRIVYFGPDLMKVLGDRSGGMTYYYRVRAVKPGLRDSGWRNAGNGCRVELE